jgi:hypothetical protein
MKLITITLFVFTTIFSSSVSAQQTSLPRSASEVTMPVTGAIMHEEYVKTIGRLAYVWGWPMVNSFNRRTGIT